MYVCVNQGIREGDEPTTTTTIYLSAFPSIYLHINDTNTQPMNYDMPIQLLEKSSVEYSVWVWKSLGGAYPEEEEYFNLRK